MISLSEPCTSLSDRFQALITAEFLSAKVMDFIGIRSILLLVRYWFVKLGAVNDVESCKILVDSC